MAATLSWVKVRARSIHPALEVAGNVGERFARAQPPGSLINEERAAPKRADADFERHSRAQRRLLEDEHQLLAGQRARELRRARLHQAGQLEETFDFPRGQVGNRQQIGLGKLANCFDGAHWVGALLFSACS
jgi:hypothetical protein